MFRGNAARTGFVSEQAAPPLAKVWEFQAGGEIFSSPVVYDNTVYVGSRDNNIYAFDVRTGAELWRFGTAGWVDASPTLSSTTLYVPSMDGYLYALDRFTGAFFWKADLGAPSVSSPLLLDGKIFVGVGGPANKLKILNSANGNSLSERSAGQPVDSAPSTDGDRIYYGANDGKLYAISKSSLLPLWSYQTMGGRYGISAVPVSSAVVYALPGYDENKPLAFDMFDGTLLNPLTLPFEANTSWEQLSSPVLSEDRLYFSGGADAASLYAAASEPVDGALAYVWPSTPSVGSVSGLGILSSPAMANDVIYSGTVEGSLVAYSSGGAVLPLVADVSFSSPVYSSPGISNGMVFVADAGGRLAAYQAARVAAFSNLSAGAVINGTVTLKGWLRNPGLTGYSLAYSTGGAPEVWSTVISSATVGPVDDGVLGSWDTSALANGVYILKLTAAENPVSGRDCSAKVTVRVNTAPSAPTGLTAADVPGDNGNKIRLEWVPVAGVVTEYRIYRVDGGDMLGIGSVSSGTASYVDATAITGTTFTYSVRAFDGYMESGDSNLAQTFAINDTGDTLEPSTVIDLAAMTGSVGGMAQLDWTAPGNDGDLGTASYYMIKYSSVAGFGWGPAGYAVYFATRDVEGPYGAHEAQDITGLMGGVTYYFLLRTYDFAGNMSALSNTATAYAALDPLAPLPPSGLTAADTPGDGGGSITLVWTLSPDDGGGSGDVYGYKIFRRVQNSSYISSVPYASVTRGITTYMDAGAAQNIRFYYSVAAFDSTNYSQFSNESYAVSADNWRFFDASQGVSIRLADGARVDIPDNAASQNDNIMMNKLDPDTYQPLLRASAVGSANPTGRVYEVKFEHLTTKLLQPAVITLPYTDPEIAGMKPENLRLYTLSGGKWVMVDTSRPDEQAKTVSAEVMHFSIYSIMEYVPLGGLFSVDEVYTYPNPAKGDTLAFKFRLLEKSDAKIDIYNIAGEKVARLDKRDCPAGVTSEIVWKIKNMASGVYQYRFEATGAAGSKSVIKRLAIIK